MVKDTNDERVFYTDEKNERKVDSLKALAGYVIGRDGIEVG